MITQADRDSYEDEKIKRLLSSDSITDGKAKDLFLKHPHTVITYLTMDTSSSSKFIEFVFNQRYSITSISYNKMLITAISRHPNTPIKLLKKIYNEDKEKFFHEEIASNVNITAKLAKKIYEERATRSHYMLARNPNIPYYVLNELGTGGTALIKKNAAENPSINIDLINFFYSRFKKGDDKDESIIESLARNPSIPLHILRDIFDYCYDEYLNVYKGKQANLDKVGSFRILCSLASNKSTPKKLLKKLAKEKRSDLDFILAGNVASPKKVLTEIFYYSYPMTFVGFDTNLKIVLSQNPSTPLSILEELAKTGIIGRKFIEKRGTLDNIKKTPVDIAYSSYHDDIEYNKEVIRYYLRNLTDLYTIQKICHHPSAQVEDIINASYRFKDDIQMNKNGNTNIVLYLLDEDSHCYPEFKEYFKKVTGLNLQEVPENMVYDLMGWYA
jgi:hypothetical protein